MNDESRYILGIETATRTCSVAVVSQNKLHPYLSPPPSRGRIKEGGKGNSYSVKVLAEYNSNTGNNHEPHLMPLIEKALSDCNLKLADVSGIAVSIGPGSFTGLRIGIATAKGLALASEKPVVGIPTLDGLSCNVILSSNANIHSTTSLRGVPKAFGTTWQSKTRLLHFVRNDTGRASNIICPMLDAHRGEVYSALYKYSEEFVFQKMTPYMVLPLEELLEKITEKTIFVGDINREIIEKKLGDKAIFAPVQLNQPKATSIAYLGMLHPHLSPQKGNRYMYDLKPMYLRKARAEEEQAITLDEMKEEDIAQIMEIERGSFPSPWSETMFKDRDRSVFLVARLREKILGYAVGLSTTDELHLGNIAVHKDFRGRGIAKRLLQRIIDIARSKQMRLVTLEVRAGNIRAQNLYRKLGFKPTGRRKQYYQDTKEDAVIMTLKTRIQDRTPKI